MEVFSGKPLKKCCLHKTCKNEQPYTHYIVTPVSLSLSSGVRRWKDLFREDPRSMGSVGHLRRRAEDQGAI